MRLLAVTALVWALGSGNALARDLTLSHQWHTSDVRHQVAQALADGLADAEVGLDLRIHPASSLIGAGEQYDALKAGRIDMAVMPLAYAAGEHPAFGLTLLPGLLRNHDHAGRMARSGFMAEIEKRLAADGLMVLVHGFLANGLAGRTDCVTGPAEAKGKRVRAADGAHAEALAAAGAEVVPLSTGELYDALQRGEIDAAASSTTVLAQDRLYEQVSCYTPPGDVAPGLVYQPLLMRRASYDALSETQREALEATRAPLATLYREEAERQDELSTRAFREAGVAIREMLPEEFEAWRVLARRNAARMLAAQDRNMLDLAFSVE